MKTKSMILIIMLVTGVCILCCCSSGPSKAEQMNRRADSIYKADSTKLYSK